MQRRRRRALLFAGFAARQTETVRQNFCQYRPRQRPTEQAAATGRMVQVAALGMQVLLQFAERLRREAFHGGFLSWLDGYGQSIRVFELEK